MWEAIGALLAIILLIGKEIIANKTRKSEYEKDTEAFDLALAAGDTDSLSAAFERMRREAGDSDPGKLNINGNKTLQ